MVKGTADVLMLIKPKPPRFALLPSCACGEPDLSNDTGERELTIGRAQWSLARGRSIAVQHKGKAQVTQWRFLYIYQLVKCIFHLKLVLVTQLKLVLIQHLTLDSMQH
jgi:hypothetical protein